MKVAIKEFFTQGNERSVLIKKNILFSFFLKGGSVFIALLLVPLTIGYINPVQYGVWLTISSMVNWINVFDIGIGNGLKNEIAYGIAKNEESNLRKYVSTSYAILAMIGLIIFMLFLLISRFLNWNNILNIPSEINYSLYPVLVVLMAFFCIQFVVQIVDAVLGATQNIFKSSIILFIGQLIALIAIYILTITTPGSLFLLVVVLAGSSLLALILASIYLYRTSLVKFRPSFKYIDLRYVRKLLNIGGAFFVIQISAMVLIHSNNFIITRILGPEAVTTYNIPFRLFSFVSMLFAIIIMPYWSAFTDAYAKNDRSWIESNIRTLRKLWFGLSLVGVLILICSPFLYRIWIGDAVTVSFSLSACMLIYMVIYMWHTLHVYFLNGCGKIRMQFFVGIFGAILNIPLAIFLGRRYGLTGIVSANSITFALMSIIYTVQYQKIVNGTAMNLWDK